LTWKSGIILVKSGVISGGLSVKVDAVWYQR
jgi:hypothetical protein